MRLFTGPKGTKSKRLSAVEFRKSLRRGGVAKEQLSDHHAECIFHAIDADADGLISVGEITGYFARSAPQARAATAAKAGAKASAKAGGKKGATKTENQKPVVLPTGEEECTFAPQTNKLKSEMVRPSSPPLFSAPSACARTARPPAAFLPAHPPRPLSPPSSSPPPDRPPPPPRLGLGAAVPPNRLF